MRTTFLAAALAAAVTLTALPASAQRYGDWGGGDIVVRHDAGVFRFDSRDPEYRRLVRNFGFRPGRFYEYTHACNGYGCEVIEYGSGGQRALDRFRAPYFRYAFDGVRVPGNPHHNDSRDRRRWR